MSSVVRASPLSLSCYATTTTGLTHHTDGNKAGELWAITLSENGQYLAGTSFDGRINVWDLAADKQKIQEYETKGSFGLCIDMVSRSIRHIVVTGSRINTCSPQMANLQHQAMLPARYTSLRTRLVGYCTLYLDL